MTIKGVNGYWNIKAEVYEKSGSVNINNNTSVVRVDIYVGRNSGAGNSYIYGNFSGTITVNGSSQSFSGSTNGQKTINAGAYWYTGITKDFTVTHNADGSKSVGASFSWSANFSPTSASASGTLALTTIARKTACPSLTGFIKSSYNLTLSPKSTSFTHSLKVVFGSLTKWLQSDGTLGTSEYKFSTRSPLITIPSSFYSQFTGYEGNGTLYLYTYNGSTSLGYNTGTLKAQCNPAYKPDISSYSIADINNTTLAITGDANDLIQNASNAYITLTTTAGDSDDPNVSITSKTINNVVFTTSSVTINETNTNVFVINLINSRNITNTITLTAGGILIPYIKPTLNIESIKRNEPTGDEIEVSYDGNIFAGSFTGSSQVATSNTLTISWKYREKGTQQWTVGGTLSPTIDSSTNTFTGSESLGHLFNYQKQYEFKFTLEDLINEINLNANVSRGLPIYWWSNDSVHFLSDIYINDNKVNDYCVETGTSGIWKYRIWASGTAECWAYKDITGTDNGSQWGNLYIFNTTPGNIDYPFTFVTPPREEVNITTSYNACFLYKESSELNGNNTTTHTGNYRPCKAQNAFANQTITISYYVIGTKAAESSL